MQILEHTGTPVGVPPGQMRPAHEPRGRKHGSRARYVVDGCRCWACKKANAAYRHAAKERRDLVDATPVRAHLEQLVAGGIQLRTLARALGVSASPLREVAAGRQRRVSARTAEAVLGVAAPELARIPAALSALLELTGKAWHARAACAGLPPGRFYPDDSSRCPDDVQAVCAACPVRQPCLHEALASPPDADDGMWAGTTPAQRRRIRVRLVGAA